MTMFGTDKFLDMIEDISTAKFFAVALSIELFAALIALTVVWWVTR